MIQQEAWKYENKCRQDNKEIGNSVKEPRKKKDREKKGRGKKQRNKQRKKERKRERKEEERGKRKRKKVGRKEERKKRRKRKWKYKYKAGQNWSNTVLKEGNTIQYRRPYSSHARTKVSTFSRSRILDLISFFLPASKANCFIFKSFSSTLLFLFASLSSHLCFLSNNNCSDLIWNS